MAAIAPNSPEGLALGVGAVLALGFGLWVLWKVGKFLVKVALLLLALAIAAAALQWWLSTR